VRWARQLAACVDINDDSARALNACGVPAERFVLGYSNRWDHWGGSEIERNHDVIYVGTADERQSRLLGLDVEVLEDFEVLFAIQPRRPMTTADSSMSERKLALLAASRVMLNVHRLGSQSLDWVRTLEAMCNGCVTVSEHSLDVAPLVPGRHLVLGRPRTLARLACVLLRDPARLRAIRNEAYEFLKSDLTMRPSALLLAQLAADVRSGGPRAPISTRTATPASAYPTRPDRRPADEADAVGPVAAAELAPRTRPGSLRGRRAKPNRDDEALDVVLVGTDESPDASVALAPLLPQLRGMDVVVHLCVDGVATPRAVDSETRLYQRARRGDVAALLNEAIVTSDAAMVLVLGTGDQLGDRAVQRLRTALCEEGVDAAYGIVVTPQGLLTSVLPLEADRLVSSDYIAMAALWRRASLIRLGGWSEDPMLRGAENWDLWRQLAISGGSAVMLQRPLVQQAFSQLQTETMAMSAVDLMMASPNRPRSSRAE
jgi:hypothetical protein